MKTHYFYMDRLMEYGLHDFEDPWGEGFRLEMVLNGTSQEHEPYSDSGIERNASWHAARIRYLMVHPKDLEDPIWIDCECNGDRILAQPCIIDGWHRFFAHIVLQRVVIAATFGGLCDVCDYLEGRIEDRPEDW